MEKIDKLNSSIEGITQLMLSANIAVPIIAGTIGAIVMIIKSHIGKGPSLPELANTLEAQIKKTGVTVSENEAAAIKAALGVV